MWASLLFYYLSPLKDGLALADQVLAALLFVSHLILIMVWCFAGPITASILAGLSAMAVLYVTLATKEPWLFLQVLMYGFLYLLIASFLYEIQKKVNDKRLARERLDEDTHLARKDMMKQEELERALNRRVDRFLELHQFAEALKGIPKLPEVAHRVVEEAHELIPHAEECVLYLVDEEKQCLVPTASARSLSLEPLPSMGSLYDQWVMRRSRPLLIEDSLNDFRFSLVNKEESWHLRSLCGSPLMTENKVLGVLRVSSKMPNAFKSDDLHALDIIASQGAVSLRNRLLYDRMEELAVRDTLTGLYLNRYFQERLKEEITRTGLQGAVFSVVLIDVDRFKDYNDEFGHAAGDLVLKSVATILQRHMNSVDIAARYGGEEFVLLLPGKNAVEAAALSNRIRMEVASSKMVLRRIERAVTVSMGVAAFPKDADNAQALVKKADDRLYQAKKEGRNRVCGST